MEDALQEVNVARSARSADLIDTPGGPGMDRWVDVRKSKFVSRNLAVRMHVPLPQKQLQLLFREGGVKMGKWQHVEREIPSGKPGILPFIRHRNHVPAVHLQPIVIST